MRLIQLRTRIFTHVGAWDRLLQSLTLRPVLSASLGTGLLSVNRERYLLTFL